MQRLERTLRRLFNQDVARTNAAGASAAMRARRDEHDEVDSYLVALARAHRQGSRGVAGR